MLGLGWVPTFFFVITILGYVVPYLLSVSFQQVYFLFPAISDSGIYSPGSHVFRELLNISGFLSVCNIYVRNRQIELILSALREPNLLWIRRVNFWCTVDGLIGGIAVTFVANFKSKKSQLFTAVSEHSVHKMAAGVVFSTGLIYCIIQTYISFWLIEYKVNRKTTCFCRTALTLSVIFNFVVFILGGVLANKHYYQQNREELEKLFWTPEIPGYMWHVMSNVAEWLMCLSFVGYSLTFVHEFKKIRITSDFVEERERLTIMGTITQDIEQSTIGCDQEHSTIGHSVEHSTVNAKTAQKCSNSENLYSSTLY